ncbi:MAG: S8 family serine peptidase [Bryobacteraceae bacterium]
MFSLRASWRLANAVLFASALLGQDVIQLGGPVPRGAAPERAVPSARGYIVTFAPGTTKPARALAAMQAGAQVRHNYDNVDAMAVTLPNDAAVAALRARQGVLQVTPDYVVRARVKPGAGGGAPLTFNPLQLISYEVQRVGIPAGGSDGTGIGVAVLDTGIDFNHPDLNPAPNGAATAFNAITPGASCQDNGGHGTHVSGLIAASNNAIGIVGMAPEARLYCVKVLDANLTGTDSNIMAGLDWVLQNRNRVTPPIRVVNVSLGRPLATGETFSNSPLRPLIQSLYNAGVVVVAAAGNDATLEVNTVVPAGFPEVISVASTVATNGIRTCQLFGLDLTSVPADTASGFTTDGADVTTSAPGEERSDIVLLGSSGCVALLYGTISTTLNTGGATRKLVPGLQEARGTSFSTSLVTGVVARVIQKRLVPASGNGAEVEGIRNWIRNNASRRGAAPLDHPWGGVIFDYSFDGVREGIAQAPK